MSDIVAPASRSNAQRLSILVVDDETNIRKTLAFCLEADGHDVATVSNPRDAAELVSRNNFDLAFVDLRLGVESGLDLIPIILAQSPWTKIVVITAYASIETAVEAMRRGATDYMPKPFTPGQVLVTVARVARMRELEQRVATLQASADAAGDAAFLQSNSPGMQRALHLAQQIASSDVTVLIRGESGTGKTLVARAIHGWSNRSAAPFATVSCPALSHDLLESELFGHVRGAFTGALRDNPGRIAACEGGTILLDEIGDLPQSIQAKLLRFLQDKNYERVGDHVTRRANVRILAATNRDLTSAVKDGRFREDLYYRLNVVELTLPPLRERQEDILPLSEHFLTLFAKMHHKHFDGFTEPARRAIASHTWPGNIRELRNAIERAAILCSGASIGAEFIAGPDAVGESPPGVGDSVTLAAIEELHIRRVLAHAKSIQEAADILGIDQATLWRRRKQYGI